jgi:hypothetical protein
MESVVCFQFLDRSGSHEGEWLAAVESAGNRESDQNDQFRKGRSWSAVAEIRSPFPDDLLRFR